MSPSNERSAEFLRGAIWQWCEGVTLPELNTLLAAAEAREAGEPTAAEVIAAAEKALDLLAEDIEGSLSQESFDAREEATAIIARWKEASGGK